MKKAICAIALLLALLWLAGCGYVVIEDTTRAVILVPTPHPTPGR